MLPAVALLGWTVKASASGPVPPPPPPPIAIPQLLVSRWSYGQAAVRSAATATVRYERDRKSTRLNSSHGYISYAVFCLKKKKHQEYQLPARKCNTKLQTHATR